MKYCVLVKISKQQLTFWYQLEGGEHMPFSINGTNTIPLCFYVNGNDFKVGDLAKERILVNDKNTYNNYFEIVKDPTRHFTLHGDSKPVKQLLYFGIEYYLSQFVKIILYKNESIEGFRSSFCLRFWFEDDIASHEKKLVLNLFKEAGYDNVDAINIDLIFNTLISSEIKSSKSRLCLSAISNDLYIKLYKAPDFILSGQFNLEQLGSDPRAKILAKLILEDIKQASSHIYFDEEKELPHIITHCVQMLSALTPVMRGDIYLSSGIVTDYKIKLSQLEDRLNYNRAIEDKVIPNIDNFLLSSGLSSSSVEIILNGHELNTDYFKDKLTRKFSSVFGIGIQHHDRLLKSIFTLVLNHDNLERSRDLNSEPEISSVPGKQISSSDQPGTSIPRPTVSPVPPSLPKSPPILATPKVKPPVVEVPPPVKVASVQLDGEMTNISDLDLKELRARCHLSALKLIDKIEKLLKEKDIRQPQKGDLIKILNNIQNKHYEKIDSDKVEALTSLLLAPSDTLYKGNFKESERVFLKDLRAFQNAQKVIQSSEPKGKNVKVTASVPNSIPAPEILSDSATKKSPSPAGKKLVPPLPIRSSKKPVPPPPPPSPASKKPVLPPSAESSKRPVPPPPPPPSKKSVPPPPPPPPPSKKSVPPPPPARKVSQNSPVSDSKTSANKRIEAQFTQLWNSYLGFILKIFNAAKVKHFDKVEIERGINHVANRDYQSLDLKKMVSIIAQYTESLSVAEIKELKGIEVNLIQAYNQMYK